MSEDNYGIQILEQRLQEIIDSMFRMEDDSDGDELLQNYDYMNLLHKRSEIYDVIFQFESRKPIEDREWLMINYDNKDHWNQNEIKAFVVITTAFGILVRMENDKERYLPNSRIRNVKRLSDAR